MSLKDEIFIVIVGFIGECFDESRAALQLDAFRSLSHPLVKVFAANDLAFYAVFAVIDDIDYRLISHCAPVVISVSGFILPTSQAWPTWKMNDEAHPAFAQQHNETET